MSVMPVVKMGNRELATPSSWVENFSTQALYDLIADMQDTKEEKGGIGLAAPQLGYNQRIIIFGFEHTERYPNEKPVAQTLLIKPVIEFLSDDMIEGWEACVRVPGLRGLVPRYKKIKYTGYDPEGHLISRIVEGFHARIVQHECDHLEGILFPQRIRDLHYLGYEDELKAAIPELAHIPIKKYSELKE